ncbi:hypothetical protein AB0G95_21720 [Streptomyces virginiae]|uniref:hypothetical protein n=1 Tax=Streptomyces virginiae TaxID=1961 RepID=UPI003446D082
MGIFSRKPAADSSTTSGSSSGGWTPAQRAGQQRLNDRLTAARRAPRQGREPQGRERLSGGA